VSAFRRVRKGRARASFPPVEANLLRNLSRQLIELLRDDGRRSQGSGDALESLFDFDEPVDTPQDPVLARLLPDAYDDPDQAAEFRRFTEHELRDAKVVQATAVIESLERGGLGEDEIVLTPDLSGSPDARLDDAADDTADVEVDLDVDAVQAWLRCLTDLRLALAERLEITEEDMSRLEVLDEDDPQAGMYAVYGWLGYLQETLVDSVR
jgi:Domain of unknown function (DUF2017)